LTDNLPGGQLPPVHWRWSVGLLSQRKKERKEEVSNIYILVGQNDDVGK
jgi:hypothetical protein